MARIMVRVEVPPEMKAQWEQRAAAAGCSVAELVRRTMTATPVLVYELVEREVQAAVRGEAPPGQVSAARRAVSAARERRKAACPDPRGAHERARQRGVLQWCPACSQSVAG